MFSAYPDLAGGDGGHLAHRGAFTVSGSTSPPVVGGTAAVLQENAVTFTLVRQVFLANMVRCITYHSPGGASCRMVSLGGKKASSLCTTNKMPQLPAFFKCTQNARVHLT